MAFKINGTTIKNPTSFKISRYNITNLKRLANGSMGGVRIAQKRKCFFTYAALTSTDWQNILTAIWEGDIFITLTYPENGVDKTMEVYVGEMPAELHFADNTNGDVWVWKNITFNLIER